MKESLELKLKKFCSREKITTQKLNDFDRLFIKKKLQSVLGFGKEHSKGKDIAKTSILPLARTLTNNL